MTLTRLHEMADRHEKIAMLTCYDATFAKLMEHAGVDILLVGDSLGMVLQGAENTLNVSMHHMTYHTKSVAAGAPNASGAQCRAVDASRQHARRQRQHPAAAGPGRNGRPCTL